MSQIPYKCTGCGAEGIRLYRLYQTFSEHADLKCRPCAEDEQRPALERSAEENASGVLSWYAETLRKFGIRDQIGWRVAAVPTEDGETFWGYTSVPQAGRDWWNALPEAKAVPK